MPLRLLDIEGLAMTGQLKDVKLVEVCKNKAKLIAIKDNGEVVESVPVDRNVAAKSYFIVLEYINKWGKEIASR